METAAPERDEGQPGSGGSSSPRSLPYSSLPPMTPAADTECLQGTREVLESTGAHK